MKVNIYEVFDREGTLIRTRFVDDTESRYYQHYNRFYYPSRKSKSCFFKPSKVLSPLDQAREYDKRRELKAVLVATIEVEDA